LSPYKNGREFDKILEGSKRHPFNKSSTMLNYYNKPVKEQSTISQGLTMDEVFHNHSKTPTKKEHFPLPDLVSKKEIVLDIVTKAAQ
jgi:hypothetical protein